MKAWSFPGFRGLNNVGDSALLGLGWLKLADNCVVTPQMGLERASGHTARVDATHTHGAYGTIDHKSVYLADNGVIYRLQEGLSKVAVTTLSSLARVRFAEVNGVVFYTNGTDFGAIYGNVKRPWGITPPGPPTVAATGGSLKPGKYQVCYTLVDEFGQESSNGDIVAIDVTSGGIAVGVSVSGAQLARVYATAADDDVLKLVGETDSVITYSKGPDELDAEIPFLFLNGPRGTLPAFFSSRMYLGEPYPTMDLSVVWRSKPLHYHLFDSGKEGVTIPGYVRMLAPDKDEGASALIVGTDRAIYALAADAKLTMLEPYGVVSGDHASRHGGKVYFWTERGLCRAMPFENLTESSLSVPPGIAAGGAVIEQQGFRRYMVALQPGGEPYNART